MKLSGKTAIVTGASRGIGRAVARKYVEEGARVIAVARDGTALRSLTEELGREGLSCSTLAADLSVESDRASIIRTAFEQTGEIDVLANVAGVLGRRQELTALDLAEWKSVFAVNVDAVFDLSRMAAQHMAKRRSGSIINVTSGVVRRPVAKWGAYLPSKFALEGLSLMLAEELRDSGVRVNMIDPGRTDTDMIRMAFPDIDPMTYKTPAEITEPFVFLASDESKLVTGTRIQIR